MALCGLVLSSFLMAAGHAATERLEGVTERVPKAPGLSLCRTSRLLAAFLFKLKAPKKTLFFSQRLAVGELLGKEKRG